MEYIFQLKRMWTLQGTGIFYIQHYSNPQISLFCIVTVIITSFQPECNPQEKRNFKFLTDYTKKEISQNYRIAKIQTENLSIQIIILDMLMSLLRVKKMNYSSFGIIEIKKVYNFFFFLQEMKQQQDIVFLFEE